MGTIASSFVIQLNAWACGVVGSSKSAGLEMVDSSSRIWSDRSWGVRLHGCVGDKEGVSVGFMVVGMGVGGNEGGRVVVSVVGAKVLTIGVDGKEGVRVVGRVVGATVLAMGAGVLMVGAKLLGIGVTATATGARVLMVGVELLGIGVTVTGGRLVGAKLPGFRVTSIGAGVVMAIGANVWY